MDCFVFPKSERRITENLVLGVSLGAHAAWSTLFHEPRVTAGVIIIGCPDYVNLMSERARLSKLETWKQSDPPGTKFLGSESFPQTLVELTNRWDPAGLLLGQLKEPPVSSPLRNGPVRDPTDNEKKALRPILQRSLAGKSILNIAGGVDKLVPYQRGEPVLGFLKKAIAPGGWFEDGKVSLEDLIFEGAGHEVTPPMVESAIRFIGETLAAGEGSAAGVRTSRL
jgi:pimeloyl-ACP methyl ester carboxylesterase